MTMFCYHGVLTLLTPHHHHHHHFILALPPTWTSSPILALFISLPKEMLAHDLSKDQNYQVANTWIDITFKVNGL